MAKDINVTVIGGCGFLGQHVVAELLTEKAKLAKDQETGSNSDFPWTFKEIKVLDGKPFSKELLTGGRKDGSTVTYETCDILDLEDLKAKLQGTSAVINCSAIDPDFLQEDLGYNNHIHQINVEGPRNVIKACQSVGVRCILHTSSVIVKMGGKRLIEHTETMTPEVCEKDLVLGEYAKGRLTAEQIVLKANGTLNDNGTILKTMVMRPPSMYGEGDKTFIPMIYRLAKASGNKIPSFGNPAAFTQCVYAGNVAVCHIYGLKHLLSDEGRSSLHSCAGLPVYVTDDSPPQAMTQLAAPFLSCAGIEPANIDSYWSTSLSLYLSSLERGIWSKFSQSNQKPHSIPTWRLHQFAAVITVVSRMRAELCLGYYPFYSWEQAVENSKIYYKRILS